MRGLAIACVLVLALSSGSAIAETEPASATSPAAAYSSSATPMGVLLANPAAKAVLEKALPEFIARMSDNMERVSGMTLREIQESLQAYAPDVLSDAKLAAIDLELAKIPVAG